MHQHACYVNIDMHFIDFYEIVHYYVLYEHLQFIDSYYMLHPPLKKTYCLN